MEVRELRAGVLVYRCSEIVICNPEYILECESYPDKFEPIPLNEERLLNFGFIKVKPRSGVRSAYINNGIRIEKSNSGLFYYKGNLIKVHQLQNLYFALTGKELSLKDENTF